VNPANNYRNGTLYPAYTAAAYKRLFELADKHKVNLLGMLSWSFEFEGKDYFEGFRSLATNGIDKPVLNVFRMFGMMDGERVATTSSGEVPMETMLSTGARAASDVNAMATVSTSSASVLLWNYHDTVGGGQAARTAVEISGLPARLHRVLLQNYRIDDTHSNAYTIWLAMGSPQQPTEAQIAQLEQAAGLQLVASPEWIDVNGGSVAIWTEMPRESVSLLSLSW
jgi:xylan 1,4-beta-xylosidase